MNEGFFPLLEDTEFSLGAIDGPSENTAVSVKTTFGEIEGNAIGIDQYCEEPFVTVYSWQSFDEEMIAQLAEEKDEPMEEIEEEINLDEKVCVLDNVIPLREVKSIDHNTGDIFL